MRETAAMSEAKNEKIARAIRAGVDGDYDLGNYETVQVGRGRQKTLKRLRLPR